MKVPKDVGPDSRITKASLGVVASERVSLPRSAAGEMRHLTCNEKEVEDYLSAGESTYVLSNRAFLAGAVIHDRSGSDGISVWQTQRRMAVK